MTSFKLFYIVLANESFYKKGLSSWGVHVVHFGYGFGEKFGITSQPMKKEPIPIESSKSFVLLFFVLFDCQSFNMDPVINKSLVSALLLA